MLEKAKGYGYKKVGFILDRGYFSRENIEYILCYDAYNGAGVRKNTIVTNAPINCLVS